MLWVLFPLLALIALVIALSLPGAEEMTKMLPMPEEMRKMMPISTTWRDIVVLGYLAVLAWVAFLVYVVFYRKDPVAQALQKLDKKEEE